MPPRCLPLVLALAAPALAAPPVGDGGAASDRDLPAPRVAHGRLRLRPPPRGLLALTFDDGPSAATTQTILDELSREGAPATFFVNAYRLGGHSQAAARQRELLAEEVARGHLVGNHTFDHQRLSDLPAAAQEKEIVDGERGIARVLGQRPWLFRPPYGRMAAPAARVLAARGYTVVQWNISSEDPYLRTPEKVLDQVMAEIRREGGGVVLFHDTHPWTAAALPLFFAALADENCHRVEAGEEPLLVVGLDRFVAPSYGGPRNTAQWSDSDREARRRIAEACRKARGPDQEPVVDEDVRRAHPR